MFETKIYKNRRNTLKKSLNSGLVLLLGNEESSMNYADNCYRFRQDSTFLYYIGLNKSRLAAIIDVDEDKEFLFGDDPTIDQIVWTGKVPSLQELTKQAGMDGCRPYEGIRAYFDQHAKDRKIHYLPPYRPGHTLKLQEWLGLAPEEIAAGKSVELIKGIVEQRNVKSEQELARIEEAVNMSGQMHLEAIRTTRPGMKEYEVMSRVHQKALELGGRLAFPIILTKHGETLHNHSYDNTIEEGDMVLCDAGAEHPDGYAGDLTRTFPAGRHFNDLQRTAYNIVLEAQIAAVDVLKPGVRFLDVHLAACKKLVEGLKHLNLMKGNPAEAVQAGTHAMFFQCGLGHLMGLDVHDMENLGEEYVGYTGDLAKSKQFGLKSLRLGRKVEPGFVVTVEPGLYFIPELIDYWGGQKKHEAFINYDKLEEFRDFGGIRIEDDYIVTEGGCRLLGNPIPKKSSEIEELRRKALEESTDE
ncbi:aminopeptidase P family protein [Halalkalibaculum sp. DA3122]|uniref:aminopeptidase P family protein n=1 Tax=Halalkalibaculum sp. DA3122 TaxID=3373607 RepID=UPI0037548B61